MRFFGFEFTPGFILFMAWLNFVDTQGIFPMAVAACAIHELGHCAAIWRFGGRIRHIKLSVAGAEIRLETALGYVPEGMIALAGPGMNLLLAAFCTIWNVSDLFAGINLVLGCLNLLPLMGLDGSRALFCGLVLLFGTELAEKTVKILNRVGLLLFTLLGIYFWIESGNFTIAVIIIWLFTGEIGKKDGFRSCHSSRKGLK